MFKRFLTIFALVLLVSACATQNVQDDVSISTDGEMVAAGAEVQGMDGYSSDELGADEYNGANPGTQQDLVVNVGDRIYFGYDQHSLTYEAKEVIENQSLWLKKYPNINLVIEGHCDERGTREYNLALGEKRAVSVRNYLVALGIDPARLETISYGKERPAVTGSDEEAWAQNRRSVLVVE